MTIQKYLTQDYVEDPPTVLDVLKSAGQALQQISFSFQHLEIVMKPTKPTKQYLALLKVGEDLLKALDLDIMDEAIRETPRRFAKMWQEFWNYKPGKIDTVFTTNQVDQMVVVSGMKVWSMCEHHLLPFWVEYSIGYIPQGHILGLSKFARIAHMHAHKLQTQERLTGAIADEIESLTGTADVAVVGKGEHLCMTMRGIQTPALMKTSDLRGVFRDEDSARAEFFQLINS